MFTKTLLVVFAGVIVTSSVVSSEETEAARENDRREELEETLESEENPKYVAVSKRERIETQRKREIKKELLELEKLTRVHPVSEESDKNTKREEAEIEIEKEAEIASKRERPHTHAEREETVSKRVLANENGERELRETEEEKERREIEEEKEHREIEEKAVKGEESELNEEKTAKREESEHNGMRREGLENLDEDENKLKGKREFEILNDPEREETEEFLLARREFPKWMKAISRQFPGYRNLVTCALKKMQAARKAMQRYKIKNCDRYFRCRGSRDVVTKCGGYSIAVAVLVSKRRQWRTGGADRKYEYGPDIYGRNRGNCIQRYIYDTMATARPCHLPYILFK